MRQRLIVVSLVTTASLGVFGWTYAPEQASSTGRVIHATGPVTVPNPTAVPEAVLMSGTEGSFRVVYPSSGDVVYRIRRGGLSPNGSLAYDVRGKETLVRSARSGTVLARTPAPQGKDLQVASASGRLLAFAAEKPGGSEWLPAGRARTKITIVPTGGGARPRTYDLEGNFGIEAFSLDDRQLFLLEYMPALNPWHYGLRRLILESGEMREIKRSKQNAPGQMNGTGQLALFSPSGHELYTLYTQQGPNYSHVEPEEAHKTGVYAFIHLLNLGGAWTHCIDLPAPFGTGDVTTHAMAISDDGTRLYVADPSSGGLAVIDPQAARVLGSTTTDLRALRSGASAAVSPDGTLYLAGHHKILAFEGDSLRPLRIFRVTRSIAGIATSADGSKLYAGAKGNLLVLDALSGHVLQEFSVPGTRQIANKA